MTFKEMLLQLPVLAYTAKKYISYDQRCEMQKQYGQGRTLLRNTTGEVLPTWHTVRIQHVRQLSSK